MNFQDQCGVSACAWELETDVFFSYKLGLHQICWLPQCTGCGELEGEGDACILQRENLKPGMLNPVITLSNDKGRIRKRASKTSLGFKSSKMRMK